MNRIIGPFALLLLLAVTTGCRPQLVVRLTTEAFPDGSLDRRLEIVGRTAEGDSPAEDDWLEEKAGIRLASPELWKRVERGPGRLRAEGIFGSAAELPAVLLLQTEDSTREAPTGTRFEIDDRVVLRHYTYVEHHGDPFRPDESRTALDALVELVVEALEGELYAEFGEAVDPAPAADFLRNEARALASSSLVVGRDAAGWENISERAERWSQVLAHYGVTVSPTVEPDDFWDEQLPGILDWGRRRVAAALTTPGFPVRPDDLAFWPTDDDYGERATEIATKLRGSEEKFLDELERNLAILTGYYGAAEVPRFRFECRVRLPGTLLTTNGTPDGDEVVWLFREHDLARAPIQLRATSIELEDEALVSLGARRNFSVHELLQLDDLLGKRDPQRTLLEVLARAVAQSDLDLLRDEDKLPVEIVFAAAELADLLSP